MALKCCGLVGKKCPPLLVIIKRPLPCNHTLPLSSHLSELAFRIRIPYRGYHKIRCCHKIGDQGHIQSSEHDLPHCPVWLRPTEAELELNC